MQVLATKEMVAYCFHVLYKTLTNEAIPPCPSTIPDDETPVFITYKTIKGDNLRGCIGNFEPRSLHQQLREYAVIAAVEDHRFEPMTIKDLRKVNCTVSLLHSFEKCPYWTDWVVGKHGIRIAYKQHRSTFLPCVAEEQGWNQKQTVTALLSKGGFRGEVTQDVLENVEVTRYQVSSVTAGLEECPFIE